MKLLRWKSKYLTGNTSIDARTRAMADTLNSVIAEADAVEHCEDLNEFTSEIVAATDAMLARVSESSADASAELGAFENELRDILVTKLPLAARGTPACDDCGMCSLYEKKAREWLGGEFTDRAKSVPKAV
jgi:hypothetical protein